MKVLHLSTTDATGGAGIAASRLHKALRNIGVESFMLVQNKSSNDEKVIKNWNLPFINGIRNELDNLPIYFKAKNINNFSISGLPENIIKNIKRIKPDLVHLHWINGGFAKLENLKKIKVPILWTLHDMWPFTGGCHYDNECNKYLVNCIKCPELIKSNLSEKIFQRKQNTYQNIKTLHINGLSKWIANCASESLLFKNKQIHNIPNCIDTSEFYPINKKKAKQFLGFDISKKLLLFGGIAAFNDYRKGFDLLWEALKFIKNKEDFIIAVFGTVNKKISIQDGLKIKYLGHHVDINSMRNIYSAADIMIIPSRQENLSNVVLESISCATPVIAFNIGGMSDMIEHKLNGYLASPYSIKELATGIEWILNNPDYQIISLNSRKTVVNRFDSKLISKKYLDLYLRIVEQSIA